MQAEWSEFDKEPSYWVKPSAHTKQRKTHRLPLSPPAMELIERLRKARKGILVFPGDVDGEPLKTLFHVWAHVRKHAQLEKDEDLELETFDLDKDKLAIVRIEPDPAKLDRDIALPPQPHPRPQAHPRRGDRHPRCCRPPLPALPAQIR